MAHSKDYGRAYYRGRTMALLAGKSNEDARAAGRAAARSFRTSRSQAPTDSPSERPFQRGVEGGVSEEAHAASTMSAPSPPDEAPRFISGETFCSGCGRPLDLFVVPHDQNACWGVRMRVP